MSIFDLRLETERLLLRPPCAEDFDAFPAFCGDPLPMQHLGGVQAPSVAWRSLATMAGSWHLLGYSMFSVIEKDSGRWVGRAGPWQPHGWPGPEVGWSIVPDRWGRGYAPEAARAAIDWAFDVLGWEQVIHTIAPDNRNSQAVARKLGARVLRHARLPPPHEVDVQVWGQPREAWKARR